MNEAQLVRADEKPLIERLRRSDSRAWRGVVLPLRRRLFTLLFLDVTPPTRIRRRGLRGVRACGPLDQRLPGGFVAEHVALSHCDKCLPDTDRAAKERTRGNSDRKRA